MVKIKGPILSTEASGKLADVLCFLRGRQTAIAKKYAVPKNNKSPAQIGVRAMVAFLAQQWRNLSAADQATWQNTDAWKQFAPYHAYMRYNMIRWNNMHYPSKAYPAAELLTPTTAPALYLTASIASIEIETNAIGSGTCWGYVHFQSTSPGFTPRPQNTVHVQIKTGWSTRFLLTPVQPGTYYHRSMPYRLDGRTGNMTTEETVTVT